MKISGSEQVQIDAVTNVALMVKENSAIEQTTKKLCDEGKTVLNIIHGTPWNGPLGVYKTLTFLWEGDDQHPLYIAAKQREAAAAALKRQEDEKKRMEAAKKAAAEREINQIKKHIKDLEISSTKLSQRINRAEDKHTEKKDLRKYKTFGIRDTAKWIGFCAIPFLFAAGSLAAFISLDAPTMGVIFALFFGALGVVLLRSVINTIKDKKANPNWKQQQEKELKQQLEAQNRQLEYDRANLTQLKAERENIHEQISAQNKILYDKQCLYNKM